MKIISDGKNVELVGAFPNRIKTHSYGIAVKKNGIWIDHHTQKPVKELNEESQ